MLNIKSTLSSIRVRDVGLCVVVGDVDGCDDGCDVGFVEGCSDGWPVGFVG